MKRLIVMMLLAGSLLSQNLPTGTSTLFSGSGNCTQCHTGSGTVLMEDGKDISPVTLWRSSMMGNSSKDPLWRAVVSEEVTKFPALKETIESTCTKCHAPMGLTEAVFTGAPGYSMDELKADPLANDGVSCTLCHQVSPENMGQDDSYSGGYIVNNTKQIFGPYMNPFTGAMFNNTGYMAEFSDHVNDSELCATCHTLFTPYLDDAGQIAGTFPEQTPYLEWKNSAFEAEETECQTCHMPITETGIDIAAMPPWHTVTHSPFWKHEFTGGNTFMLGLLKDNATGLGLTATEAQFDTSIASANKSLLNGIDFSVTGAEVDGKIELVAEIENKSGHKFPTGIPFRRMWIKITVTDSDGNVVFNSGDYDEHGELVYKPEEGYQTHYDLITSENQTQIYEAILGDVNGEHTYTLLRASTYLKDNRLPPRGFVSTFEDYENIAIYGEAVSDPDFNKEGEMEGTGKDLIRYVIDPGYDGDFTVKAELLFQSVNPGLVEHLSEYDTEDINAFLELYENSDNMPVLLAADSLSGFTVTDLEDDTSPRSYYLDQNYPNPFNPETKITFSVAEKTGLLLEVFDVTGNKVATLAEGKYNPGEYSVNFSGSNYASGIYFYRLTTEKFALTKKMILLK